MAQAHAAQGGRNRLKLRALALAAAAAQGCVSAPPEVRHPDEFGAIAVVAGTKQPEVSWRDPRYEAEGAPPRAEATMPGAPDVKAIQATLHEQVMAAFSARGSRPVEPRH